MTRSARRSMLTREIPARSSVFSIILRIWMSSWTKSAYR